jgi:outer membrane lipopolysaccharide assembly protein LptE/RlpB
MRASLLIYTFLAVLFLQACSSNGYHLRKNIDLPVRYQRIQIENISYENGFVKVFEEMLEESGGELVSNNTSLVNTKIKINNLRESKRIVAYTSERKAREYLLSLKFDYSIESTKKSTLIREKNSKKHRINLDRVFIYDADFALGKEEEENKIRQNLYEEAARLILLKLQYAKE